ncbi:uncharacterized protein BJ171DRAFT_517655 [Polychytrium aggregatum]|uniref:uncharacterized protein n=1 Tax=Polychytrium aggregatum TaxID=110093 RepID=UPI0022FE4160|nr:uncharacterized protein BJ171DRAFT_517655 [Polychytrium aggregatum]KAI9199745.1 hypothetical protein BJ171DRAFT_517655 [Polychytrium aggregatum]
MNTATERFDLSSEIIPESFSSMVLNVVVDVMESTLAQVEDADASMEGMLRRIHDYNHFTALAIGGISNDIGTRLWFLEMDIQRLRPDNAGMTAEALVRLREQYNVLFTTLSRLEVLINELLLDVFENKKLGISAFYEFETRLESLKSKSPDPEEALFAVVSRFYYLITPFKTSRSWEVLGKELDGLIEHVLQVFARAPFHRRWSLLSDTLAEWERSIEQFHRIEREVRDEALHCPL